MEARRIALLRLSSLGDATLVLAAVRALQDGDPSAHITWITSPEVHELVGGVDGIEFVVIPKPRGIGDYLRLRRGLAKHRFDVLLAMQASLRCNLIYPWIRAKRRVGFDRRRARDGQRWFTNDAIPFRREHLLDSFLSFVRTVGIETGEVRWDLPIEARHAAFARDRAPGSGEYVVLHPFSSKRERDWPIERYARVVEYVDTRWSAPVVLTGGSSARELEGARQIERLAATRVVNLVGESSPLELAAVLQGACFVLAPDTAAVHLATAVGTPVLGLYAVAPSWLSGPYASSQWVIDRHDRAVETLLHEDPDAAPWGRRVHDPRAMELIEVEDVRRQVDALMMR